MNLATSTADHACQCQSLVRTLVLLADAGHHAELVDAAARFGWEPIEALQAFRVDVGPGQTFASLEALADFLRGLLPASFATLRIAWINRAQPISRQLTVLAGAQPIGEVAPQQPSRLTEIIEQRAIETWFQPIFRLEDVSIWGYECLMRGRDADGSLLAPLRIIDWARRENLTFALDRVCRERHIENAARAGIPEHCHLLINFLPTVIYQPEVCLRTTMLAMERFGIAPSRIIFEVVESELVNDRDKLRSIMDFYRRSGMQVALDDLGAGYAGLNMMADLAPDLIKLDRGLISRACQSSMHRSICRAVADLGRNERKLVLAEGVETVEELDLMRELGVDLVQGYLLGKPAPQPALHPLPY
jgi:EAL domain-containing protein (putative c-di-GMP-specific phosphodiesterase class I)